MYFIIYTLCSRGGFIYLFITLLRFSKKMHIKKHFSALPTEFFDAKGNSAHKITSVF